jgi:hypothetical protein
VNILAVILEILASASVQPCSWPAERVILVPAPRVVCRQTYTPLFQEPRWPAPYVSLPTPPMPREVGGRYDGADLVDAWQSWREREIDRQWAYWKSTPGACQSRELAARGDIDRHVSAYVHSIDPAFD